GRIANMYRILYDKTASQLNGGLAPELNALNVPSERPNLTLLSAAAISNPAREVTGGASPEAAAAAACENDDKQTAEALRRHLRMGSDKLASLILIVRLYPNRRPWLENEANLCFATLKKRPIG